MPTSPEYVGLLLFSDNPSVMDWLPHYLCDRRALSYRDSILTMGPMPLTGQPLNLWQFRVENQSQAIEPRNSIEWLWELDPSHRHQSMRTNNKISRGSPAITHWSLDGHWSDRRDLTQVNNDILRGKKNNINIFSSFPFCCHELIYLQKLTTMLWMGEKANVIKCWKKTKYFQFFPSFTCDGLLQYRLRRRSLSQLVFRTRLLYFKKQKKLQEINRSTSTPS